MNKLPYKYRTKLFFNHIIICASLLLKLFIKISRNLENILIHKEYSSKNLNLFPFIINSLIKYT